MLLRELFGSIEIHRLDKVVSARFLKPFRVGSTSHPRGGIREDLEILFNHQACEPSGHESPLSRIAVTDPDEYHRRMCRAHGFDPERTESLGTAANMNHLSIEVQRFRDLKVAACVTAGVESNAGRAGDRANYFENDGLFERISDDEESRVEDRGTIVTMVFINHELTPTATIRAVMTATEAKTSVLQELMVPSRYSAGLATGTGTDQIAIASSLGSAKPLRAAGKHSKLGELIARAVRGATFAALERQNGLTPARQCSVATQLARFGISKTELYKMVAERLSPEQGALLLRNIGSVDSDGPTVAAVAALAHLADQLAWGILTETCTSEIVASGAALVSAAVSGDHQRLSDYRMKLAEPRERLDTAGLVRTCVLAIALGYNDRWSHHDINLPT